MAAISKPVTIRFVGDESKFRATTEAVGGRLRDFGKQAEDSGRRAGEGFDRAAEGADNAEGKAQGFASTLTGTKDLMSAAGEISKGNLFEGFVMAGQGAADLAEGLNYTVIPAAKAAATAFTQQGLATIRSTASAVGSRIAMTAAAVASKAWAAAQWLLNAAMTANPIGIVIAVIVGLVAAIVIAYQRSETFRNIVQTVWKAVQTAVGNAVGFILDILRNMLKVWFTVAENILKGAARAFGWIPGVGDKLKKAEAAFGRLKDNVLGKLAEVADKARGWGAKVSSNYAKGIDSNNHQIAEAANKAALAAKRRLNQASPAKEGPLSEDGGSEGWGAKLAALFMRGMDRGAGGVGAAAGRLAGAARPDALDGRRLRPAGIAAGAAGVIVNVATNANPHQIGREVAWSLKTSGF